MEKYQGRGGVFGFRGSDVSRTGPLVSVIMGHRRENVHKTKLMAFQVTEARKSILQVRCPGKNIQ